MELKYENLTKLFTKVGVLIVPLWNWNDETEAFGTWAPCSNRTFMELKLDKEIAEVYKLQSSNRTFMELKFLRSIAFKAIFHVLIVPLWNWNPIWLRRQDGYY